MRTVEDIIAGYLPEGFCDTAGLQESMSYSVLAGGKRIRPTLMRETYKLFGGEGEVIEPFMAALEFIHTYSLVHDDLPAMDGDRLRRGRDTTWVRYGEAGGVLAGDALLTMAFEICCYAFDMTDDKQAVASSIRILADRAGCYGMCGGQALDLEAESSKKLTDAELIRIYKLKTGALLEAAMMIGAALAGAEPEKIALCSKIAADIGVAFQIRDDILDVTADEAELGKPIGSDEANGKTTYVSLHGLEAARARVHELIDGVRKDISELPGDKSAYFDSFLDSMESRTK